MGEKESWEKRRNEPPGVGCVETGESRPEGASAGGGVEPGVVEEGGVPVEGGGGTTEPGGGIVVAEGVDGPTPEEGESAGPAGDEEEGEGIGEGEGMGGFGSVFTSQPSSQRELLSKR